MGVLTWMGLRRLNAWEPPTLLDHLLSSPLTYLAAIVYRVTLFLRGRPFHPPRTRPPVRVVCISDTHDQTVSIPHGDILIHAGDMTNDGTVADIQRQVNWLAAQPHAVKIIVAGNHDSWFDVRSRPPQDAKAGAKVDLSGVHYLQSSAVVPEVNGRKFVIFGVPDIPRCGPDTFAFQYDDVHPWLSKVPPETDILITHCPPKHHLDNNLGSPELLREVWRVKPRLHIFGHVHWGHGREPVYFDALQEAYERLLSRPRLGLFWDLVPNDTWVDVFAVMYHAVQSVLWKWLMGGPGSNHGSLMVNAAQMYGNTGRVRSRAQVVDL